MNTVKNFALNAKILMNSGTAEKVALVEYTDKEYKKNLSTNKIAFEPLATSTPYKKFQNSKRAYFDD